MTLSREYHRGERRLWVGSTAMTGPEIRAACTVPARARIGIYAAFLLVSVALGVGMAAVGLPFVAALPLLCVVVVGALMALQAHLGDRRRRYGMVQVPLTTWDLIVELGKLPPEAVPEGRRLQDELVAAIASPGHRDGEVQAIEARMGALVTGTPSIPG
jgi:hypothetical protein